MVSSEPGMGRELVLSGLTMCSVLVMNQESLSVLETQLVFTTATMKKMLESHAPHVKSYPSFLLISHGHACSLLIKNVQYVMMEICG